MTRIKNRRTTWHNGTRIQVTFDTVSLESFIDFAYHLRITNIDQLNVLPLMEFAQYITCIEMMNYLNDFTQQSYRPANRNSKQINSEQEQQQQPQQQGKAAAAANKKSLQKQSLSIISKEDGRKGSG